MMRNNKGVTLVELLIVIVVMGIIAAFAVPAVGNIIENSEKDKVVSDALAVEQGADYWCLDNSCPDGTTLDWADLEQYLDGVQKADYLTDADGVGDDEDKVLATYTLATDSWDVNLEGASAGDFEWLAASGAPTDYATAALKRAQVGTQS